MMSLNILKIEEQIPQIISTLEAGEEVIIEKSGEPIAKIIPFGKKGKRKLGRERGKIWMSEDFTDPLPKELLEEFYK